MEKLIKYQENASCVILSSHDHSVLQSIEITRRNLMLRITLRAKGVKAGTVGTSSWCPH